MGPCFYIEVWNYCHRNFNSPDASCPQYPNVPSLKSIVPPQMVLILFNLLLVVLSYVSYKKALKTNFPVSRGQAYVISGDQYG